MLDKEVIKLLMESGVTGLSVYLGYRLFQALLLWLCDKHTKSLDGVTGLMKKQLDKTDEQLDILKNINYRTRNCNAKPPEN